jgi:hypothetical protein
MLHFYHRASDRNVSPPCRTLAAAARLRHLRRLDAALCCGVDDAALARLAACPSLADVNVRACWRLSEQGALPLSHDASEGHCIDAPGLWLDVKTSSGAQIYPVSCHHGRSTNCIRVMYTPAYEERCVTMWRAPRKRVLGPQASTRC